MENRMSAQEAEVAQLTQQVNDVGTELDAIHGELQTELDNLQGQINSGTGAKELNLAPLADAIQRLPAHADALKGISPSNKPPAAAASAPAEGAAAAPAAQEAAPTKPDGTAVENTTDPAVAAQQAATGSGGASSTQ